MKESKYTEIRKKIREILFSETGIVIGIGNPDRADDGAGILVVQYWKQKVSPSRSICFFLDTECSIESPVMDHLEDPLIQTFLFVDASDFGGIPGEIVLLSEKEIEKIVSPLSTHKVPLDFLFSLIQSKKKNAFLLGIQPGSLEFWGDMTEAVQNTVAMLKGWIDQ